MSSFLRQGGHLFSVMMMVPTCKREGDIKECCLINIRNQQVSRNNCLSSFSCYLNLMSNTFVIKWPHSLSHGIINSTLLNISVIFQHILLENTCIFKSEHLYRYCIWYYCDEIYYQYVTIVNTYSPTVTMSFPPPAVEVDHPCWAEQGAACLLKYFGNAPEVLAILQYDLC